MKIRILFGTLAAAVFLAVASSATAQVIVSDDFESYANDAALQAVWSGPDNGVLADETYIDIFADTGADPPEPDDLGARAFNPNDDGSTGQGVDHIASSILEYVNFNGGTPLFPTAAKSIVLQVDIFDTLARGNKRVSIGLRSSFPENLVELGQWNDPAGYAYRGVLFPSPSDPNPNWALFDALPLSLDTDDDGDVEINDIGEVWSTYRAIITPDTITYEIDLFRDGLTNATPTTGVAGVDMSITHNLVTGANGYNSLRIGGPSGVGSPGGGVVFDNVLVELVDAVAGPILGDYNGNGTVDAADYTLYRDTLGGSVANAFEGADGNGDTFITPADLAVWVANFGNTSSTSNASAVPEPTTALLACLAGLALTGLRRTV